MTPRVALMGMILESNRFARPATRADFEAFYWLEGDALIQDARSDTPVLAPEFAAFVAAMDATGPWEPVPILLTGEHPAGPVTQDCYEAVAEKIAAGLAAAPVDAVYLCHHGAMVAEHLDDPDGALAGMVRDIVGPETPVVMTLDLHSNISDLMVEATDLIVGYRTNPHVDMIERGEEAAFALRRMLSGAIAPKATHLKMPICPASVTLLTADGPYGDMIDHGQRRQAEMAGEILNVSVFGNFIFSDVPENGVSVVVTGRNDIKPAEALAREIAEQGWTDRQRFVRELTPVADAVAMALRPDRAPVIFSEAGDNPGGGGSGRTTELLAALVEAEAPGVLYGSYYDPELAAEAHALGVGARFTARFNRSAGNATWEQWDTRFEAEAEVTSLTDGDVTGRLGILAGRRLELGPCASLKIGGIDVMVISSRTQTADPVLFEMHGHDIAAARTVVVKSRGHFRAGFIPWFPPERVLEIDTAGLTSPVLSRWPFQRLPRPSFPLDPETEWTPPA